MKKFSKIVFVLLNCVLSCSAALYAQTNHDLALFEAKGPVKSITLTSDPQSYILSPIEGLTYFRANVNGTTYEFDKNGKLNFWITPGYNAQGYITSIEYGGATLKYTYTYGRVTGMDCKLKNNSMESKFTYSEKGNLVSSQETVMGGNIITLVGKYSNYVYDSHGNWIKRSLTLSPLVVSGDAPSNTVIQTRTITYY